MLLSGLAISALSKDIQQVIPHQDFLVPIFINTLLSKECNEQDASDCLSILDRFCYCKPATFQKMVQERRLVPRLLKFLEPSLALRLSTSGDCDSLVKLQEQVLILLAHFCEHPVVGVKTMEKLIKNNIQLIVQKVNLLSLKVTFAAIELLIVVTESLEVFTHFLELEDFHREIASLAVMAFNNRCEGILKIGGVHMQNLLTASLVLISQFCYDSEMGDRMIALLIELRDCTSGHFLSMAIIRRKYLEQESAIVITSALNIFYTASINPFLQVFLSRMDKDLIQKLSGYDCFARTAFAILDVYS